MFQEIEHITSVINLSKKVFPELAHLQLITVVHDLYKFLPSTNVQLGLHELMSKTFGLALFATALKKQRRL